MIRKIDELGRIVVPKEIRRTLRIREGDPLEIFTDKDGEIILKNHTKGDGVKFLAKHLNIDIADTIAFGDSMNDYQMLEVAGESYVSVLSADNLKAISDGTFEDPDDNGMAKKLKELGLI